MNDKIKKERLDIYLVENGMATSREKAKALIMEGKVYVNSQKEDKAGTLIKLTDKIECRGEKLKYVSRGGLKLEKASKVFTISYEDKICIDIGSSTGGFTDFMLQNGAKLVFAVDSGTNQLDYKLRVDKRVVSLENTNARYLTAVDVNNEKIDVITIDVSFISLQKILVPAYDILDEDGLVVMLVKPQFEAGRELVEKNGVVRNKSTHIKVIEEVIDFSEKIGFFIKGLDFSPIKGPAGNIEFLLYADKKNDENQIFDKNLIKSVVQDAHIALD